MGAANAAKITRKFLQDNYGNIGMLLYRIHSVKRNSEDNVYEVLCSILPSVGDSERIYYLLKVDISKKIIKDVFMGKQKTKDGKKIIELEKIEIKTSS